ncbi:protein UXT [Bradysia coprophila]|uniref:protein UXT n=1 Tax=Bradysia coprophila TaxID=38358 RepID=UPI00187DC211|nr:protein UXT [Bradysia coprophila]
METDKLETFINDHLREDLKVYENHLNHIHSEIMEYNQLRNTASTINTHLKSGFKTKVDVGANFFVQAKVDNTDRILVNVGLNHFVEFQLEEAIKFCDFKVRVLNKEADVIREESLKCRANIKLALMCIGDRSNLHTENRN